MTIFLTIVGTVSVMLLLMTFLMVIGNTASVGDLRVMMVKQSTLMERMAVDQINAFRSIEGQSKAIGQMSNSMAMLADDMEMNESMMVIQTPTGSVKARNVDEAIDKLRAKGVSLTDDDIQELRMLFDEDGETPPPTE